MIFLDKLGLGLVWMCREVCVRAQGNLALGNIAVKESCRKACDGMRVTCDGIRVVCDGMRVPCDGVRVVCRVRRYARGVWPVMV